MAERPLSADEAQLWARVMASVRPLRATALAAPRPAERAPVAVQSTSLPPVAPPPVAKQVPPRPRLSGMTLDGSWDRQIARGAVVPDSTLDLHGHTLHSAYTLLDHGIDRALARGDRVLLLVTGKPPRTGSERPHARGAIRAAVADWLAASRHADRIAAVRGAHPRHGGTGALYLVLRRPRPKS